MSEYPTIISFYTHDWKYPNYAMKMRVDCDRLGLEHHIVLLRERGTWIDNTKRKPQFILDTIKELKRPVLWIDVDGSIYKRPDHFAGDYDYDWAARPKPIERERKWHVGTMYFAYNDRVISFLEEWINEADKLEDGSDELALHKLWEAQNPVILAASVDELPQEYFLMMNPNQPDALRHTVIGHRASNGDSKREYIKHKNG